MRFRSTMMHRVFSLVCLLTCLLVSGLLLSEPARADKRVDNWDEADAAPAVEQPVAPQPGPDAQLAREGRDAERELARSRAGALPIYWEQAVSDEPGRGLTVEDDDALLLEFRPHEALCKSRYHAEWYAVCGRSSHMEGRPARGVTMNPPLPGVWQWRDNVTLVFHPRDAWPADTAFTVNIPASDLPQSVEIVGVPSFRTKALTARIQGDFKFDPEDTSRMGVSGTIDFNYPMDARSVLSRLRVTAEGKDESSRPLLGQPDYRWDTPGRSTLAFSVPVLKLADVSSRLSLDLEPGYKAESGGKAGLGAAFNTFLPDKNGLFTLLSANATVVTAADLRARQILALEFSLPATPEQVRPALKALLLPRQRVESGEKDRPPYAWWSMEEISPEILAQSEDVPLTLTEAESVASRLVSFGFGRELEAGRSLLITVQGNLTGQDGMSLDQTASFLVQVPDFPEELRIMQNGSVLALTGDKTLSLYSRNLDAVSYQAAQVRPEFINHLVSRWSWTKDFNPSWLNLDNLSTVFRGELPLVRKNAEAPQFAALDLAPMLNDGQKGLFFVSLTGLRDGSSINSEDRFVLVTDLGLIHKRFADGSGLVYVASLSGGVPLPDVTVRVLGANGLPVLEARTDAQGRVALPNLEGLKREKAPVAVVAVLGEDLAFLPFTARSLDVDYSRFAVGGNRSDFGGLNAYVFGERDMYRPGETAHFGFIVKQGQWDAAALASLPLRAVVTDPRGNIFSTVDLSLPASGLGELSYPLAETAATGLYNLDLVLNAGEHKGGVLQSASFRVEEFQPDTMRLTVRLDPTVTKGWLRPQEFKDKPGDLEARVHLSNLFGAPAVGHTVQASAGIRPASFHFREYSDWTFYNAAPAQSLYPETLPEAQTDENGEAVFVVPPDLYEDASVVVDVDVEGFDASGGRSVKASTSVFMSPLEAVVGWRTGSNLDYLRQGGEASLDLLAIGPDLAPRDFGPLTLETVVVTYVKSLIRDGNGQYRYDNLPREKVAATRQATLPASGLSVPLDLAEPGQRLLVARDQAGKVVARIPYTVAGEAVAQFDGDRDPILIARLDKQDYAPGDEVEVFLTTPYKGAGLITVERDTVVAQTWFRGEAGSTVQRVRLPRDFEGRAFLVVTYFRALDDRDIFTKPLATAVTPFTVNADARDLHLTLRTGDNAAADTADAAALPVVRPGGAFPVRVSADSPAKAVVFAVDEGILQLTSYRTPDPLRALLLDRALDVSTAQYFDLLMPEYKLLQSALSAFGGGEEFNFASLRQNPFRRPGEKSAVFWSGLIDVGPEAVAVDVPVPPSFSGRLRVMAVACAPDGVSAARSDVLAQAEVVIQPSLPLFVAPGDEFEATVTLTDMSGFAQGEKGRKVSVSARVEGGLEVLDAPAASLTLHDAREQTVRMRFRALDQLGGATVTFAARPVDGEPGGAAFRPVSLSVRPAVARSTVTAMGRVKDAPFTASVPFTRRLYPQFSALSASVSALPLPVAHGLMAYLDNYPYGCTEQLVSAAFPALTLLRRPELAPHGPAYTPEALRERVVRTMDMLSSRYDGDGDFSVWPSGGYGDFFLAVYAADFLTTAEDAGVSVPYTLRENLLRSLRDRAAETPTTAEEARINAYAAWVLTRNGVLTSNIMATLTAWLDTYQPAWRKDLTAVFMAGCWRLMMQNQEAERLIAGYAPDPATAWSRDEWLDGLASRSLYLSVLAGQFPDRLTSPQAQTMLDDILTVAASRRYVTVSAAQAARALMAYSQSLAPAMSDASIQALDATGAVLELAPAQGDNVRSVSLEGGADGGSVLPRLASLNFRASGPAYWQVESTGFDREIPAKSLSEGMSVSRELRHPDGSPVDVIHAGDELIVVLRARSFGDNPGARPEVAITDLLPGGFEMILTEGGQAVESGTGMGTRADDMDWPMDVSYVERREDRLLLFAKAGARDSVYRYRVRAAVRGVFTLPPVSAEAMYNPTIRAHSAAGVVTVE